MQYTTPATDMNAVMFGSVVNVITEPLVFPNGSKMYFPCASNQRYVGRYWGPNNICAYIKFKSRDIPERATLRELCQLGEYIR